MVVRCRAFRIRSLQNELQQSQHRGLEDSQLVELHRPSWLRRARNVMVEKRGSAHQYLHGSSLKPPALFRAGGHVQCQRYCTKERPHTILSARIPTQAVSTILATSFQRTHGKPYSGTKERRRGRQGDQFSARSSALIISTNP